MASQDYLSRRARLFWADVAPNECAPYMDCDETFADVVARFHPTPIAVEGWPVVTSGGLPYAVNPALVTFIGPIVTREPTLAREPARDEPS